MSHLLDVMVQARPYLDTLGVHVEACANEASAAAMLGASIHYPLRGAVTWKSIVGTNVAADALSNLASPGVIGGALVVVGEDYGEGASVIQERTHAYALKSTLLLLDPRPELPAMVRMVEHAFALSARRRTCRRCSSCASAPATCAAASSAATTSRRHCRRKQLIAEPAQLRLHAPRAPAGDLPPREAEDRASASRPRSATSPSIGSNERFDGARDDVGLIVQGGLYNALVRALQQLGLADAYGDVAAADRSC